MHSRSITDLHGSLSKDRPTSMQAISNFSMEPTPGENANGQQKSEDLKSRPASRQKSKAVGTASALAEMQKEYQSKIESYVDFYKSVSSY